jgi:hypothetical protein
MYLNVVGTPRDALHYIETRVPRGIQLKGKRDSSELYFHFASLHDRMSNAPSWQHLLAGKRVSNSHDLIG